MRTNKCKLQRGYTCAHYPTHVFILVFPCSSNEPTWPTHSITLKTHACTHPGVQSTQARLSAPPLAAGMGLSCLLLYRWAPHLWQVHWPLRCHTNQCRALAKRHRQIVFVNVEKRRRAPGLQGKRDVIWGDHLHLLTLLQAIPLIPWECKR